MLRKIKSIFDATSSYTLILTCSICGFVILESYFPHIINFLSDRWIPQLKNIEFLPENSLLFVSNFIEWFGVLYGFLLPLMLVHVWEQFDNIDREFDREADTIKILYEDILLIRKEDFPSKDTFLTLLLEYVSHVIDNCHLEAENESQERIHGEVILRSIRNEYYKIVHSKIAKTKEGEIILSELLRQLNEVIDVRGDRIALSNQRLFESLQFVSLITSIIFAVPFYFVKFHQSFGFLDSFLVFGVIFLVIFIMSTIEDLDEPFYGSWKVSIEPWFRLKEEIKSSIDQPVSVNNI